MKQEVTILVAEDDPGHALLITRNLQRAGIRNLIVHFKDGQEVLDFLFGVSGERRIETGKAYLLLLDIRMPKVDGIEVLREIKRNQQLCSMPVIMVTTTDDPHEIEHCHRLGCSNYVTKPIDYEKFVETIKKLGLFLMVVQLPTINEVPELS